MTTSKTSKALDRRTVVMGVFVFLAFLMVPVTILLAIAVIFFGLPAFWIGIGLTAFVVFIMITIGVAIDTALNKKAGKYHG